MELPANGSQTNFDFSFSGGYISQSHISVTIIDLSGVETIVPFTFSGPSQVHFTTAPPNGYTVRIRRLTPNDATLMDFSDGALVTADNLDLVNRQGVLAAADAADTGLIAASELRKDATAFRLWTPSGVAAWLVDALISILPATFKIAGPASGPVPVATRTAMAVRPTDMPTFLTEGTRIGIFVYDPANLSASVTVDTEQGVYVAPASDPTGATGAWVRRRSSGEINAGWFGASPSATGAENETAFRAASAMFCLQSGGRYIVNPGIYTVGSQQLAGVAGLSHSYAGVDGYIRIENCTKPVEIIGYGVTLKNIDGYKYGSFDPITGLIYNPVLPFTNYDYAGYLVDGQIWLSNNTGHVSVRGFELDGNVANLDLGGQFNDSGWQVRGCGLVAFGNSSLDIDGVYTHHHPLDGVEIGNPGLTETDAKRPHTLSNVRSLYNGRQGLSVVGANSLLATNCVFSHTGKNGVLSSAPGAGVDLEAESSIVRDVTFDRCEFVDNTGAAQTHVGDVARVQYRGCKLVGTTSHAAWPAVPYVEYHDCLLVGSVVNPWADADAGKATKFFSCRFSDDVALSPTGIVSSYGGFIVNFGGGDTNVRLDGCTIDAASTAAIYSNGSAVFHNFTLNQTASAICRPRGNFYGLNDLSSAGTIDASGGYNFGRLKLNGVEQPRSSIANYNQFGPSAGTAADNTVELFNTNYRNFVNFHSFLAGVHSLDGSISSFRGVGMFYNTLAGGEHRFTVNDVERASIRDDGIHITGVGAFSGALSASNLSGTNTGDETAGTVTAKLSAFTGDVTKAAGGTALTIAANAVTYAKMQVASASKLLGNPTGAGAAVAEVGIAGGLIFNGTNLTLGDITPTSSTVSGAVKSTHATAGVGYGTGAGGAVTQLTSKTTAPPAINKASGQITMNNAALAAAGVVEFTVSNSAVAATDTINLNLASGAATATAYRYWISGVAAGSFKVAVENRSAGSLSEALVFNFAVLKAVAA